MSWLGTAAGSFKAQLTELTNDVINETEIDRSFLESDFKILRTKYDAILSQDKCRQDEIQSLYLTNLNLRERVDSAEMQAATVSREFRKIITTLQNELETCKQENSQLNETISNIQVSPPDTSEDDSRPVCELNAQIKELLAEKEQLESKYNEDRVCLQETYRNNTIALIQSHNDEINKLKNSQPMNLPGNEQEVIIAENSEIPQFKQRIKELTNLLNKETNHKDRLLTHIEEVTSEHDTELILLHNNNKLLMEQINQVQRTNTHIMPPTNNSSESNLVSDILTDDITWLRREYVTQKHACAELKNKCVSIMEDNENKHKIIQNLQISVRNLQNENNSIRQQSVTSWRNEESNFRNKNAELTLDLEQLKIQYRQLQYEAEERAVIHKNSNSINSARDKESMLKHGIKQLLLKSINRGNSEQVRYQSIKDLSILLKFTQDEITLVQNVIFDINNSNNNNNNNNNSSLSWFGKIFGRQNSSSDYNNSNSSEIISIEGKSFANIFIEYLMNETETENDSNKSYLYSKPSQSSYGYDVGSSYRINDRYESYDRPSLAIASLLAKPEEISRVLGTNMNISTSNNANSTATTTTTTATTTTNTNNNNNNNKNNNNTIAGTQYISLPFDHL